MNRPILIGVVGLARSGKDTAADYLAKELRLYKYAFAEPLKTMLKSVFGDHFHTGDRGGICPETQVTYRKMMQTLGTEWGRSLHPDIWVNLVDRKWRWVQEGCPFELEYLEGTARNVKFGNEPVTAGMVISDLRFDSEAWWLKNQGGILLEIRRGKPATKPWWKFWSRTHESERGISEGFERYVIHNDGNLEQLYRQIDGFIERRVR